jgi:hemoglobin
MGPEGASVFERVGGEAWFVGLVERFYAQVEADPILRPLYPDDLRESRDHLVGFLVQYWGGPGTYSETRGHPRLRMRHAPFVIGAAERDAWFTHMAAAVRAGGLDAGLEAQMIDYFEMAATHLINR